MKRITVDMNLFWPSLAAVLVMLILCGYSCDGCMKCHGPESPVIPPGAVWHMNE